MRHRMEGRKFGRNPAQRRALLRQLSISLILNDRITTTEAKAKELRGVVEKLVTLAREDSQFHRRLVMARIDHDRATTRLFNTVAPRYEGRTGGYIRLSKLGNRRGDGAPQVLIEFVD